VHFKLAREWAIAALYIRELAQPLIQHSLPPLLRFLHPAHIPSSDSQRRSFVGVRKVIENDFEGVLDGEHRDDVEVDKDNENNEGDVTRRVKI
jgi:hypothetical protein